MRGSALKSSYMLYERVFRPYNDHVDGICHAKSFSLSNSFTPMATFSPQPVMPALPGAMYSLSTLGLWAIFHARGVLAPAAS